MERERKALSSAPGAWENARVAYGMDVYSLFCNSGYLK